MAAPPGPAFQRYAAHVFFGPEGPPCSNPFYVRESDKAPLPRGPLGAAVGQVAVLRQVVFAYGSATASVLGPFPPVDVFGGGTDNRVGRATRAGFGAHIAPCVLRIQSRGDGFVVACATLHNGVMLRPRSAGGAECDGFRPLPPGLWRALHSGDLLALWHPREGIREYFEFLRDADALASTRPAV